MAWSHTINESCYRAKLYPQRTVKDTVKCNAGCKLLYWKQAAKQDMHSVWVTNSLTAPVAALGKVGIPFLSLDWKIAEKNIRSYQQLETGRFIANAPFEVNTTPPALQWSFEGCITLNSACLSAWPDLQDVCVCALIFQKTIWTNTRITTVFWGCLQQKKLLL